MLTSTLQFLKCPAKKGKCAGDLNLLKGGQGDIEFGDLICQKCKASYPILAGVAIVVPHVEEYLLTHVKGISKWVKDQDIPARFRSQFIEAKREIDVEHIEEDLESERVNALYLSNHYLTTKDAVEWWKASAEPGNDLLEKLIEEYWDQGPLARIGEMLASKMGSLSSSDKTFSLLELGCGVGGLPSKIGFQARAAIKNYLGVDSSFASIALARKINLTATQGLTIQIPEDLLNGGVSREVKVQTGLATQKSAEKMGCDFIVGDLECPPLKAGKWDFTIALNLIDMMENPPMLPALQAELLRPGGAAIQSCPYIWHPHIARKLRKTCPKGTRTSASAVEWLYQNAGFEIQSKILHLPWLFFKHVRQLEVYSVHLFFARKGCP